METRTNLPPREHSGHLHRFLASWLRRLALALAAITLPLTLAPPASAIGPDFELELLADGLSVTGATEGGEVQIFGLWRQRHVTWSEVGRVLEKVTDDDFDGEVIWSFGKDIPIASAFFAVDLTNGAWDVAIPSGFPVRLLPASGVQFSADSSSFSIATTAAELLVVRPGEGAWSLRTRDGGSADSSAMQDGRVAISVNQLQPDLDLPALAPLQALNSGDLLLGITTNKLEIFVEELAGDEK